MGIYKTPYQRFGYLTYQMWRACRLVVDTGIHHLGWTRQQAIDYMTQNTALSDREITNEVDRYISWPGQALSYELGYLKLLELRAKAEKSLGPKFDIRAFHDTVLADRLGPAARARATHRSFYRRWGSRTGLRRGCSQIMVRVLGSVCQPLAKTSPIKVYCT